MKTAANSRLASSSTIQGQNIYNNAGEKLGKVEDVMLDLQQGKIAYVVLSFGGFLGLGDKLFAVPMQALRADGENECFHMDISKEKLDNAPGFDKNSWPSTYDEKFVSTVHTHYGIPR
ncbi:MAG TPA: PRC-barrel domain containing protein [Phycisphaerales bacterium]|nr:PRC-barrel domain containing protein [Phycisphaerales bacterium]